MAASVVPSELVQNDSPSIPLSCIICPRAPGFSDLSHFLTHVSSKSHLWHVHQVDIASYGDIEAERLLHRWNDYYSKHNVRRLEHDRQGAKGKKKLGQRAMSPMRSSRARNNTDLDGIKLEPDDGTLNAHHSIHWNYGPIDGSQHPHLHAVRQDFGYEGSRTETPAGSETEISQMTEGAAVSENTVDGAEEKFSVLEERELKGLSLPGMRCFDSATPDRKKKRNQKKDLAATEQLERDSSSVESTYMVWSEFGDDEPQRHGDVYDAASVDGSPERTLNDEAPKRRRGRRSGAVQLLSTPQPTRSSARIAKKRADNEIPANFSDPVFEPDDEEMQDDENDPGRFDSAAHGRSRVASQRLQVAPEGRIANNLNGYTNAQCAIRRTTALQPLMTNGNMNGSVHSPPPRLVKHNTMSFFNQRDLGSSFPTRAQTLSRSPAVPANSPALINRSPALSHLSSALDLPGHHMQSSTRTATSGVSPHALTFSANFSPVTLTSHPSSSAPTSYYSIHTDQHHLSGHLNPLYIQQPNTNGFSGGNHAHYGVEDRPSSTGFENVNSLVQPLHNAGYSTYPHPYVTGNLHQMQRDQQS